MVVTLGVHVLGSLPADLLPREFNPVDFLIFFVFFLFLLLLTFVLHVFIVTIFFVYISIFMIHSVVGVRSS